VLLVTWSHLFAQTSQTTWTSITRSSCRVWQKSDTGSTSPSRITRDRPGTRMKDAELSS
jgi:hypothetical protein